MNFTRTEQIIILGATVMAFLLHFIINLSGAYGFFRDELYYIACSEHLDWGYVDQPPFCAFLLKLSRAILGDSLAAIRFVPSVLHAAIIYVGALIIKRLDGQALAIGISSFLILLSPVHIGINSVYSMNSIDIFLWTLAFYLILRLKQEATPKLWIALGIVLGIGLLNKISVLFLGAGFFVAIIVTSRQWLRTPWPYIAGTIALVIFLPYIIWNITHDYAHLEFIHNASTEKYGDRSRLDFIREQYALNPLTIPLWIGGLLAVLFYKPLKQARILGWIFVTTFAILFLNATSKGEYLVPAYMGILPGIAILIEQQLKKTYQLVGLAVYALLILITGLMMMPLATPILPVDKFIAYTAALGIKPSSSENKELSELPQYYADMYGWKEKAHDVAAVYSTLTEQEKNDCLIYSTNYGRCGAIDFFGKDLGLPASIGDHNNYWWWGTHGKTGKVVILVGGDLEDHIPHFLSVTLAKTSTCQYCMPYENNVPIYIARGFKGDLQKVWAHTKHYD